MKLSKTADTRRFEVAYLTTYTQNIIASGYYYYCSQMNVLIYFLKIKKLLLFCRLQVLHEQKQAS